MPTAKPGPSQQNGRPRPPGAPVERVDPPDFFEGESTMIDSGLSVRSDWARPASADANASVQNIQRMLEETIDGSNPQIEVQRRADAAAPLLNLPQLKPPTTPVARSKVRSGAVLPVPTRGPKKRTVLIVVAGTLALVVAIVLLGRADLLPIRF